MYIGMQIFPDTKDSNKHTMPITENTPTLVRHRRRSRKPKKAKVSYDNISDNPEIQPPCIAALPPLPESHHLNSPKATDTTHDPAQSACGEQAESQAPRLAIRPKRKAADDDGVPVGKDGYVIVTEIDEEHFAFRAKSGKLIKASLTKLSGERRFEHRGKLYLARLDKRRKKK